METGKFLECALLAGACALPLLAVGAVVLRDDDAWIPERCDGCGEPFRASELTAGDAGTRWCAGCREDTAPSAPAAVDCVQEDDGEP